MDVIAKKPGRYNGKHISQNQLFALADAKDYAPAWMTKAKPDDGESESKGAQPGKVSRAAKAKPDDGESEA